MSSLGTAGSKALQEDPEPAFVTTVHKCLFCERAPASQIEGDDLSFAVIDSYPVSPGHTLIIPRRHVASWFECTAAEQQSLMQIMGQARQRLISTHQADSFNIGINDGPAAGQTVPHVHIHLIPRYVGDRENPRGGVRWILPDKADYWTKR